MHGARGLADTSKVMSQWRGWVWGPDLRLRASPLESWFQILALLPDEMNLLPGQPQCSLVCSGKNTPLLAGEMMCAQHSAPQSSSRLSPPSPGCMRPWARPRLGTAKPLLREQLMFPGGSSAGLSSPPCLHPDSGNPTARLLMAPEGLQAALLFTPAPGPRMPPVLGWGTPYHTCSRHRWHQRACRSQCRVSSVLVQSLSCVRLFVTPRIVAHQASLSITNSRSLLKLTSIKSVMPSNHLILCHALLLLPSVFASIRVFSSELALHIRWQSTGASASASVPPMNIPICRMGPTLGPGSPGYTLPRMPRGRTAKHGARGST